MTSVYNSRTRLLAVVVALIALAVGLTVYFASSNGGTPSVGGSAESSSSSNVWHVEYSERFTAESLQDIVSFADAVAVVRLIGEREVGLPPDQAARGEGSSAREVTLAVDQVLWQRPGAARTLPNTVTFNGLGYIYRDNRRYETRFEGRTDFERGRRYVAALLDYNEHDGTPVGWGNYSLRTILPLEGDRVANEPDRGRVAAALAGRSLDEISALLSRTEPHPAARDNPERSATERQELVYPREGGTEPGS